MTIGSPQLGLDEVPKLGMTEETFSKNNGFHFFGIKIDSSSY